MRHAAVVCVVVALVLAAGAKTAAAEHDHGDHEHVHDGMAWMASVGVLAASYRTDLYEGAYQGSAVALGWSYGRVAMAASTAAYRIDRNGKDERGFGDSMVHGAVAIARRGAVVFGVDAMVMLPTGDGARGLGMGHAMVGAGTSAIWQRGRLGLMAELGYARGLGDRGAHHEHGGGAAWPLVDPMNYAEVGARVAATVDLGARWSIGARVAAALAIGDGDHRLRPTATVARRISENLAASIAVHGGVIGEPARLRGIATLSYRR